jgi:outer membrane protein assembly factor BamB
MPSRRAFLAGAGVVAGAAAGCVTLESPGRAGRWTVPGGTDARTGRTDPRGPTGALYPRWRDDVPDGYPPATPVVGDGAVYHLGGGRRDRNPRRATVVARAAGTGRERWETTLWTGGSDLASVHYDALRYDPDRELLYAQVVDGVHALALDGTERWFAPLPTVAQPWPDVAAPVLADGTLVAAAYGKRETDPEIRGYDPGTGGLAWRTEFPGVAEPWTLTAAEGTVYVPFLGREAGRMLVALTADTGTVRWTERIPVAGPVTATDDALVVPLETDGADALAVLEAEDRSVRWRERVRRRVDAGVATDGERLFYVAGRSLVARDLATGEPLWSFGRWGRAVSPGWTPTVAGGLVYALATDGGTWSLYALGTEDGAVYGSGAVGSDGSTSGLAVVEGAAYLVADGLGCYETCARTGFDRCLVG